MSVMVSESKHGGDNMATLDRPESGGKVLKNNSKLIFDVLSMKVMMDPKGEGPPCGSLNK